MADPRLARAEVLLDVNRAAEAVALLGTVLAEQPGSVQARCLLALGYDRLNRPADSLAAARRAVEAAPDSEWAHRLMAQALTALGRHRDAIAAAIEAVRLGPQIWTTELMLGNAYRAAGKRRTALSHALRACELAPEEAEAHILVADVYQEMADVRAARAGYLRALQLDPANVVARHNLAVMEINRDRPLTAAPGLGSAASEIPTEGLFVRNADRAARAVLWRLVDWACFGFVAVVVPRAYAGWAWAAAAGVLVTPPLVWWLRRLLSRTPPALRTTMWRLAWRRRPAFALGVAGLIACGLGIVAAAFLPDIASVLVLPAMVYAAVVLVRVRNRLIRVVLRRIRWLWYRVGRGR